MYDLAYKLKSSNYLIEALCLLAYHHTTSPSNFHAKLLAMQLYNRIGCTWGAQKVYEDMNIKFIQLDSMGYFHVARLATSGLIVQARSYYETSLKFYSTNIRDNHDFKSMCYKYGSFAKLQDIMDFHKRLKYSSHYVLISLDILINDIVGGCAGNTTFEQQLNAFKMMGITSNIEFDKLNDNRDLGVMVSWDPRSSPDADEKMRKLSFAQDLDLIRLRVNVLQMISLCVETITKETYNKSAKREDWPTLAATKCDLLEAHLKLFTDVFAEVRDRNPERISNEFLVNLLPSRLHSHLDAPFESIFGGLGRLVLSLEQRYDQPIETVWQQLDKDLLNVSDNVCVLVKDHNMDADVLWRRRSVQETIAIAMEVS